MGMRFRSQANSGGGFRGPRASRASITPRVLSLPWWPDDNNLGGTQQTAAGMVSGSHHAEHPLLPSVRLLLVGHRLMHGWVKILAIDSYVFEADPAQRLHEAAVAEGDALCPLVGRQPWRHVCQGSIKVIEHR